jgi:hypothetical protein
MPIYSNTFIGYPYDKTDSTIGIYVLTSKIDSILYRESVLSSMKREVTHIF